MKRASFTRLMPATASVLIHIGIVATVAVVPAGAPVRLPMLIAELVELDVTPAPAPARPPVPKRDPRPLTPPRPITTPLPLHPPARVQPEVEPPKPAAPEPPPVPTPAAPEPTNPRIAAEPVRPSTPDSSAEPSRPADAALPTPAAGAFVAPPAAGPAAAPSTPARSDVVAGGLPDGVTHRAIPRGGYQYLPSYPSSARRLGIQGTTLLQVLVSDDGRVSDVIVKQSAGHPDLDQAAVNAVRRWRFEPARRGPEPVAMWVQLPFEFRFR
jgi:periplasmic protein TonB